VSVHSSLKKEEGGHRLAVIMHFPKTYNTYFVAMIATVGGMLSVFALFSITLHSHMTDLVSISGR
jgi:hypothetical protein